MEDLKTKTVMVVDNGLFVSFARTLSREFKKVYYCAPWITAFPKTNALVVGAGFEDIERVKYPLDYIDEVDLWVFLDLYHSDLQNHLEKLGKRVWGARYGEELELERWDFKQLLKKVGLPVQPIEKLVGVEALVAFLKKNENKYVKTSFTRGDFESFRHDTWDTSESKVRAIAHQLGAAAHSYEFVVENEIPDAVEVGYDGFGIDGQWPDYAMMAYEIKDCGLVGTVKANKDLCKPVLDVNRAMEGFMKASNYRGFFSTEIRYTSDSKAYFIDPCCRLGTPSNELLQELFEGWGRTLWEGAAGRVVSPKPCAKFGVLAVVISEWAGQNWSAIHYPKGLDRWVKLRFHTRIDDKNYSVPQQVPVPDVGYVVGTGDSLLQAIKVCKERAGQIKGYQVEVRVDAITKALEVIAKGQKRGVHFSSALPSAEEVRKVVEC